MANEDDDGDNGDAAQKAFSHRKWFLKVKKS